MFVGYCSRAITKQAVTMTKKTEQRTRGSTHTAAGMIAGTAGSTDNVDHEKVLTG